jgi:hypothetical protein
MSWCGLLLATALSVPAFADEAPAGDSPRLEAHVDFQNLGLYRNDSDFDATLPLYRENGKSVGGLATVLRPDVTWHIAPTLRIFYQAEIGLNYWGKQNPDEENAKEPDVFVMKHRELWGEGSFAEDRFGFKVGYAHFLDSTGLFLNHWIGMAEARTGWGSGNASLFFGQVPDQVYEGINISENNFTRDIDVWGAAGRFELGPTAVLRVGLHNLYDRHVVDQTRWVSAPNARLELKPGPITAAIDAVVEAGKQEGLALGGGDETIFAWAVQGHVGYQISKLALDWNAVALSGDDDYDGNGTSRSFLYSGKNHSATLMLTEDEIRDWYDNFDEQMSSYRSGFFETRAGLFVTDLKASWALTEALRPALVVGFGSVLNPDNALGGTVIGLETDLILEYRLSSNLDAQAAVGGVIPGAAGGALVNHIDLGRTDPLFMAEGSLLLHY